MTEIYLDPGLPWEDGFEYKVRGIRWWVKPIAIGTHLATGKEWLEVWGSKHAYTWSRQEMIDPASILWRRRRRA